MGGGSLLAVIANPLGIATRKRQIDAQDHPHIMRSAVGPVLGNVHGWEPLEMLTG